MNMHVLSIKTQLLGDEVDTRGGVKERECMEKIKGMLLPILSTSLA